MGGSHAVLRTLEEIVELLWQFAITRYCGNGQACSDGQNKKQFLTMLGEDSYWGTKGRGMKRSLKLYGVAAEVLIRAISTGANGSRSSLAILATLFCTHLPSAPSSVMHCMTVRQHVQWKGREVVNHFQRAGNQLPEKGSRLHCVDDDFISIATACLHHATSPADAALASRPSPATSVGALPCSLHTRVA